MDGNAHIQTTEDTADGAVYTGIAPDTGRPLYAAPEDAPMRLTWGEALQYAHALVACGHDDWRLPSEAELNVLFNNRAAIGNFNLTGVWYWSADEAVGRYARTQEFRDGARSMGNKYATALVRCVRG